MQGILVSFLLQNLKKYVVLKKTKPDEKNSYPSIDDFDFGQ